MPPKSESAVLSARRGSTTPVRAKSSSTKASPPLSSSLQVKYILVPIDFSDCSKKALRYAIPLAKQQKAALTLLYVVVVPSYFGVGDGGGFNYAFFEPDIISLQAELRANGEKQLAAVAVDEVRGEVESQALVRIGDDQNGKASYVVKIRN